MKWLCAACGCLWLLLFCAKSAFSGASTGHRWTWTPHAHAAIEGPKRNPEWDSGRQKSRKQGRAAENRGGRPTQAFLQAKAKVTSPSLLRKALTGIDKFQNDLFEEIRYHKLSLSQYRDKIYINFNNIFDKYTTNQWKATSSARDDIQGYVTKFNQIYNEAIESLERQKDVINAMNAKVPVRPKQFDESLEQFKKFYNESRVIEDTVNYIKAHSFKLSDKTTKESIETSVPTKRITSSNPMQREREFRRASERLDKMIQQEQRKEGKKKEKKSKKVIVVKKSAINEAAAGSQLDHWGFPAQLDLLHERLKLQWAQATRVSSDSISSTEYIRTVLNDLHRLQDDLLAKAQELTSSSQQAILDSKDKYLVRREKDELKNKLTQLEDEVFDWVDDKRLKLDAALKLLQERVAVTNQAYEELVGKRQASMQFQAENDQSLNRVLKLIDPASRDKQGWKLIRSEGGYEVYRKFMGGGTVGSQFACIMCHGMINSSPESVHALFEDNTRVAEYNSFFKDGRDIEVIAEGTKVTWACSPPVFPFKARDFCTIIHMRRLKDGTRIILNRATKHPLAPPSQEYVRASIILAANIIQPIAGNPNQCHLTMLTQMDPGGFAPPSIINHICTLGPIGFLKNVEVVSRRKPSRAVMLQKLQLIKDSKGRGKTKASTDTV